MKSTIIASFFFITSVCFARQKIEGKLQSTPAGFLPNEGQIADQNGKANPEVHYLLSSGSMNIELKSGGFSFDLFEKKPVPRTYPESGFRTLEDKEEWNADQHYQVSVARIDVSLLGANKKAELVASDACEAYCNFYNGTIGVKGITKVPAYQQVMYKNIYRGIDLVFLVNEDADQPSVEYSFKLHPGANAKDIKLEYKGCEQLSMDQRADLEMSNQKGWVTQTTPTAYTETTEQPVNCTWKLRNNIVSFDVASTSTKENIIIDPNIIWGTYYGGEKDEMENGELAIDSKTNILLTASTASTMFIATAGAYQTSYAGGNSDAFLAKFTKKGKLTWATYYGGSKEEDAYSADVDPSDNIFICGNTQSSSGIATAGAHQTTLNGTNDMYVAKFNSSGQLQWGTYYGGTGTEQARSLACDNSGNAYIGCYTQSSSGISTAGVYQQTYGGNGDAAVAKFTADGQLAWGSYYGGVGQDRAHGVYADANGNIFLCGTTESSTNIATAGAYQTVYGGDVDAFVAKFNASNGQIIWGTYFGGEKQDHGRGIQTDKKGNVYFSGFTTSCTNIAHGNSLQSHFGGVCGDTMDYDGIAAKFSPSGRLLWSTYFGGLGNDIFYSMKLDASANVYSVGSTTSNNIHLTSNALQKNYYGPQHDGLLLKTDSLGNLSYSSYFGLSGDDSFFDVGIDSKGLVYFAELEGGDSYVTPGVYQTSNKGGNDYLLYQFNGSPACDDVNEPNEDMTTATGIKTVTDSTIYGYTAAISSKNDQDWYSVSVKKTAPYLKVSMKDNSENYSLALFNSKGNMVAQALPGANGNVYLYYNNGTKGGTFYIQIGHTSSQFDSINCYRLLAVVSSSPFTHSPERDERTSVSRSIHVDPNPANDLVRMQFYSDESGNGMIKVYNLVQQLVFQANTSVTSGNNDLILKLPILSPGEYVLQCQLNDEIQTAKIIIAPGR